MRYVPAVSSRLRKLLYLVLALFTALALNGMYLAGVTFAEWLSGDTLQNYFYQYMFLAHLGLGLLLVVPVVVFGIVHIYNAHGRPNRRAVQVGYALYSTALCLLVTGVILTRVEGIVDVRSELVRGVAYWTHIVSPLLVIWLFVLHRLAGPPIQWRVGAGVGAVGLLFAIAMAVFHAQDPRRWNVEGPASGEKYFFPSLARTATGQFIPASVLMADSYCKRCHADVHRGWVHSMHRFSSFNNPAYRFSVRETRRVLLERDGNVQASRFCAGCHDPVPFFSGAFDDPHFDDERHPTASAGITCTVCHAVTHINSPRGNADYTIEEPTHYPFAFSDHPFLQWVNEQLVKAKPALHKKTFLKPLHRTPEFCGTCHKVHLPKELNDYKWLRGQNHYDSYHLSGVSGHGAASFYYPDRAEHNCNGCHMPLEDSNDFGARDFAAVGQRQVHGHLFPSANTAIPHLLDFPDWVNEEHRKFLRGVARVDIFGLREGGVIDGELRGPIRPALPTLMPERSYLLEVVIRTLRLGHLLTQGTADSNELWLEVSLRAGDELIGHSGGRAADGGVDPWSHFVNAYVLDRYGERIDRRNAQDIFVPLYNHQIPPGASDVVHYRFVLPKGVRGPVTMEVKLQYRKFDTTYMQHIYGPEHRNDLPITTIASDRVTLPIVVSEVVSNAPVEILEWERWNDYGIGLLRKGSVGARKGELRQAEEAFQAVERLKHPYGPLNLARTYIKEGRLEEATQALRRAAQHDPPAPAWSIEWFTGLVNKQNGFLDEAIENFRRVVDTQFVEAVEREFAFGADYRVLNELGLTVFERSRRDRGERRREARHARLREASEWFQKTLAIDPENVTAHFNLARIYAEFGDAQRAQEHRALHGRYRPDDNSRGTAVRQHRSTYPAADHAAESVVIYNLQRVGAFGLGER